MMATLGSIPEPQASVDSLLATVKALKQVVEGTTGQRADGRSPVHTVSKTAPLAPRVGDMWTRPAQPAQVSQDATYITTIVLGSVLSTWDGSRWVVVNVTGEYVERRRLTNVATGGIGVITSVFISPTFGGPNQIWAIHYTAYCQDTSGVALFTVFLSDESLAVLERFHVRTVGANLGWNNSLLHIASFTRPRFFFGRAVNSNSATGTVFGQTAVPSSNCFRAIRLL